MPRNSKFQRSVTVGLLALAAVAVVTGWLVWGRGDGTVADPMPDFATFALRGKPNEYLALPPGFASAATPHAESPVFELPPPALVDVVLSVIRAQPRVEEVAANAVRRQYAFVQRTALLRFPDTITVRVVETDDGRSSLAIYSRSKLGRSDLGANRQRVETWLSAIHAAAVAP